MIPTVMTDAPVLGLPVTEPVPPPDCDVCQSLARQREDARRARNWSRVSDCNVEIRNHHTR